MRYLLQAPVTRIFVSHNMAAIQNLCAKAILLRDGAISFNGATNLAIENYREALNSGAKAPLVQRADRRGDGRLRFERVHVKGEGGAAPTMGSPLWIELGYRADLPISAFNVTVHIQTITGQVLVRLSTAETGRPLQCEEGTGRLVCHVPSLPLLPGTYSVLIAASVPPFFQHLDYVDDAYSFEVLEQDVYKHRKNSESRNVLSGV